MWDQITGPATEGRSRYWVLPIVSVILIENFIFLLISALRYVVQCLQMPNSSVVLKVCRLAYMPVLVVHLYAFMTYLGVIFCWAILAAVLKPEKFLPYGV